MNLGYIHIDCKRLAQNRKVNIHQVLTPDVTDMVWGPFHERIFHRNSNSMEI